MESVFVELLKDFTKQLGIADYPVDERGCELELDNGIVLSIVSEEEKKEIFLIAELGTIEEELQSKYALMMLKANWLWAETNGFTFSLDSESNIAVLQDKLSMENLSVQELYNTVELLVQTASYWKEQIQNQ